MSVETKQTNRLVQVQNASILARLCLTTNVLKVTTLDQLQLLQAPSPIVVLPTGRGLKTGTFHRILFSYSRHNRSTVSTDTLITVCACECQVGCLATCPAGFTVCLTHALIGSSPRDPGSNQARNGNLTHQSQRFSIASCIDCEPQCALL